MQAIPSPSRECVLVREGDKFRCTECGSMYPFVAGRFHAQCRKGMEQEAKMLAVPSPSGPGTELKKLLSKVGITTKPGCACNRRARVMDEKGCDWCAENLSTIVGWLKEEHTRQKIMIPFSETAVSLLVRYAIRRARAITK